MRKGTITRPPSAKEPIIRLVGRAEPVSETPSTYPKSSVSNDMDVWRGVLQNMLSEHVQRESEPQLTPEPVNPSPKSLPEHVRCYSITGSLKQKRIYEGEYTPELDTTFQEYANDHRCLVRMVSATRVKLFQPVQPDIPDSPPITDPNVDQIPVKAARIDTLEHCIRWTDIEIPDSVENVFEWARVYVETQNVPVELLNKDGGVIRKILPR